MIKLSNGHVFEYMVASGSLAFDGKGWPWEKPLVWLGIVQPKLFTVVIKTLTLKPRKGNLQMWKPWECVKLIPGGSVNKVGLTNPGIDWWCQEIGPRFTGEDIPLIGSIFGNKDELVEMAVKLNKFNLVGLEVNYSCPNTGHKMQSTKDLIDSVLAVKMVSRHPIIVKVSVAQDYLAIAHGLEGVAEAISLNSVPWEIVFPGQRSPLWKLEKKVGGGGGGVSGKAAQRHNWKAIRELSGQNSLPVIGASIMNHDDLNRVRILGATAFAFGAIHLKTPWLPTMIVKKENPGR